MRLNKRKVYFFRLFICIAVVISILVITATVFWLRSNVDRGDYDIFVSNMSDYQENLVGADTRISVARTVAMLLTEYDCVKKYAQTDSEYEQIDFGATLKIKEKILENQTVFQNLEYSIYVTGFSADFVVSCNGTMDIASMYSETGIDKQIIDKTFNQYIMPGKYSELIVTDEGENACYVTKCIYEDMETIYIINKLWAMEGISYTQRDGMTFVYIDGELNGFAKAGVEEHILNLRKNGSLPADQIVRMGSGLVLGDVFFRMMSHQPNVAVVGYYAAEVPAESIMHYTLIVLLSLIAAMILALVIAKTAYRPIDKLVNIFSSGEFYYGNEIEFITGKLEEIKNANSILNSTLDSQKNLVAKKILSDILNGYIWGNSIDEYAQEYQLKAFETNSVCILFEVNDSFLNVSRFYADDEIRMIMSNVFDIIESEFARKQITAFGFLESGKRILFVAKDCDTLKSDVISITDTIRSQTSINIVAVMSNKAQSFEGLRDMYSQLLVAIDKKLIFDDREMFMINDLDNQTELDWYYPINVESELIEYVVNGEKEKMIFLIKKLFDYNSKSFEKSSKNLNAFNFSMSVTIKRILQKINRRETICRLELVFCFSDLHGDFSRRLL